MQRREVMRLGELLISDLRDTSNGQLFALINNAGCARSWYTTMEDGYEQQFALNFLGGISADVRSLPDASEGGRQNNHDEQPIS